MKASEKQKGIKIFQKLYSIKIFQKLNWKRLLMREVKHNLIRILDPSHIKTFVQSPPPLSVGKWKIIVSIFETKITGSVKAGTIN